MIDVLSDLSMLRGVPEHVRSDNGPAFIAGSVQAWISDHLVGAGQTGIVNYGIERWYGAQGVPGKLDRTARKDILVEVRVASDGTAVIDGITVAGKPFAKTARLW